MQKSLSIILYSLLQEESVHDSLAIAICNELLSDPLSSEVRVYSRTLSSLDLTPSNTVSKKRLVKRMCGKKAKNIIKFVYQPYPLHQCNVIKWQPCGNHRRPHVLFWCRPMPQTCFPCGRRWGVKSPTRPVLGISTSLETCSKRLALVSVCGYISEGVLWAKPFEGGKEQL
jgi:hypothetical protein